MRLQSITNTILLCSMLVGLALGTSVAKADEPTGGLWMIIGDGGKLEEGVTPNRVMHFAYAADIRDLTDTAAKVAEIARSANPRTLEARLKALEVKEMDVIEIFEHPTAPGFKMVTMQFQCTKELYRVSKSEWKERNSVQRFGGATEWQRFVPRDWRSRAYLIACFPEVWTPLVQSELQTIARTKAVSDQDELREYGLGLIGTWRKNDGINQVYRMTWDKIWAGTATPIPFHNNRTPAEEAEYQAWKTRNDAIIAQNERDAPAVLASINALQGSIRGELTAMDAESAFMRKVAANFSQKNKSSQDRFLALQGWTEREIVDFWGVPNGVRDHMGTRSLDYKSRVDTRRTEQVNIDIVDSQGQVVGSTTETREAGYLSECDLTLFLEEGGSKPGYRLVDYRLNGTGCTWDTLGRLVR
jgi:hypothetical protein